MKKELNRDEIMTKLNGITKSMNNLSKQRTTLMNKLTKIQLNEDTEKLKAIPDGEINWELVLSNATSTVICKYQNEIITKLGMFTGGIWTKINQVSLVITKNMIKSENREKTLSAIKTVLPHYKTFKSELDGAEVIVFSTHDKYLSSNGNYLLEVNKDMDKIRIVRMYYTKPEIILDWMNLNVDALKLIKNKIM